MRILLIDQFDICREGMKFVLLQMDKSCEFIEASSIEDGIAATVNLDLDMIIVDLDVPEIGSMGMLSKINEVKLTGNIILFSTTEDYAVMRKAYEMGISAFIGEQTKKEITTSVFRIVLAGGRYFSPEVIGGRQSYYVRGSTSRFLVSTEDQPALSNRQFDVLKLLAEGQPNKLIARELNIATGTVKVHISGILKALKAKNRTQAVSIAKHIKLL